jgi:Domain of unknown function (DUF4157)
MLFLGCDGSITSQEIPLMQTFQSKLPKPTKAGTPISSDLLQRTPIRSPRLNMAPPSVQEALHSSSQPLDPATRALMEPLFGHDFSRVRVHTDTKAAESAQAVNALAYTVGRDVVFGAGQYAPETTQGKMLLAHELTHTVQQQFRTPLSDRLEVGAAEDSYEKVARERAAQLPDSKGLTLSPTPFPALQRQPVPPPTSSQTATSTFSVVQSDYLKQVNRAIQNMSGGIIGSNTLAGPIQSMLQAMVPQVTWRDANGKDHGGNAIKYQLSGTPPLTLNLRLVLDDMANPPDGGRFEHTSKTDGKIIVRIQSNPTADELTKTLFHEGLHLMSEIVNELGAPRLGAQDRLALRGITLRVFQPLVNSTRNQLDVLAKSVNARRKAAGQSEITSAGLDKMAPWLVEEVLVRAETEVFRLYATAQQTRAARGPSVVIQSITSGGQSIDVNLAMVNQYVFQFSNQFQKSDESSLSQADKQLLLALSQMLDQLFQGQVKRRFSWVLWSISVPRARFQLPPTPLTPPASFGPPPLPSP